MGDASRSGPLSGAAPGAGGDSAAPGSASPGAAGISAAAKTELARKSIQYRRDILRFIATAGAGHTGGSLSCIDIINVLYNAVMDITPDNFTSLDRDHYIQSKGHSVEALYVVLADLGFFDKSELETGGRYRSHFIGHPTRKVPGIEHNTGGLGHGLSVACGLALAAKMDGRCSQVYCLIGDGELAEGSNWEAAMSAAHYKLDNLTAVIDRNRLQITGNTEEILALESLHEKWRAFGWEVREVDGNDVEELLSIVGRHAAPEKPTAVIAHTVKGKGVSFIEGRASWHHHVPTAEELKAAFAELDEAERGVASEEPAAATGRRHTEESP